MKENQVRNIYGNSNYRNCNSVLFDEVIEKFYFLKRDLKPTSLRTFRNRIEKWIRPYFGYKQVVEITKEDILDWFLKIRGNLRSNSQVQVTNLLKQLFAIAQEFFDIDYNPVAYFNFRIRSDQKQSTIWDRNQYNEFIVQIEDPHLKIFYEFLFNTGLRIGEITALMYRDVDLDTGMVRVYKNLQYVDGKYKFLKTKSAFSDRFIYIPKAILKDYKDYLETIGDYNENDRIFYRNPNIYRNYLRRFCEKRGLEVIKPHGFRHSFGTMMLNEGQAPNDIQYWLGHSRVSTTLNLYTQPRKQGVENIKACLDDQYDKEERLSEEKQRDNDIDPNYNAFLKHIRKDDPESD